MNRANKEMAYHALEVLHGINLSGMLKTHYELHSSFEIPPPLPRGYASGTHFKFLEENAIAI
jgi:hypothetical protein